MAANAAIGSGCMPASQPPASTMSISPLRKRVIALAMASVPEAQADTEVLTPPLAEMSMPIAAAGPFGMSMGTVIGKTLLGPFDSKVS